MQRDSSIDILRFIGLSLLILAHVDSPFLLKQIRMFDVPMMVFISGLSYSGKRIDNIGHFYWSRLKRLLIPVWTFIPIYLLPHAFLQSVGLLNSGFTWKGFFESFIFYGDAMGYIWIFKVFIIVMIATPFLIRLNERIKNNYLYFSILVVLILLQQFLCSYYSRCFSFWGKGIVDTYGLYILGYLPMFMLGLRVRNCERSKEIFYIGFFLLLLMVSVISVFYLTLYPFELSLYKYPPQAYYCIYGCFMSLICWFFRKSLVNSLNNRLVISIGKNTDWIYLWHAFFVIYVTYFVKQWYLQYIIIYLLAIIICMAQKHLVNRIPSNFLNKYY